VKEQLLVELSHTPIAILAVIGGWSRWLELRLPEPIRARKCLAWLWPVCFIMIGLILMGYHEADIAYPSAGGLGLMLQSELWKISIDALRANRLKPF
jgi:hypothetical protein